MVDLHCHILPGIDDGAQALEDSIELLKKEQADGVTKIIFTPHFNSERTTVEEFVQKRAESFEKLKAAADKEGLSLELKLGAEVFFSSDLPDLDLEPLCFEGTSFMLVEFSPVFYPEWARQVFYQLQLIGIDPILAHVERYPYMLNDPTRLYDLADAGILLQVNASSLFRGTHRPAAIKKLLKWNLCHLLSTDTHSMDKRPPRMAEAMSCIEHWYGADMRKKLVQNAVDVFNGFEPNLPDAKRPKKLFNRWF